MDPLERDIEVGCPGGPGDAERVAGPSLALVASIIFLGSMLGRLLGLVREQLAASRFGAGDHIAAFTVADNLNTLIFDLMSSGMLEAALIPVLSVLAAGGAIGRDRLRRLTGLLLVISISVATALTVIGVIFAPVLVRFMTALGGNGETRSAATTTLAVQNLRIVLPSLIFLVAGTVMIGALYAVQKPGAPALSSAARNLGVVLGILVLGEQYGVRSMAVGVLAGAIALSSLQWGSLQRAGLRPQLSFHDAMPELREIGRLYLPVFLGLIVSALVVVVDRNLAWRAETDAVGAMRYATTLVQLILGLVVAAVSLAVLPQLSSQHAIAGEDAFRAQLVQALKLVTVLLVPAVIGMAVLAGPIVRLLFEHGETGPEASKLIVAALLLYLPGHLLAGYDQVMIFAFYARKNTLLPVAVGVVASVGYLIVALAFFDRYQMRGLVFANTAQFTAHTALMLWFGRGMLRREGFFSVGSTALRAVIASVVMAGVVWTVWRLTEEISAPSVFGEIAAVTVPIVAGVLVYGLTARALGIGELNRLLDTFERRFRQLSV